MTAPILTLDITGSPHRWMTWQDAVVLKVKNLVAWELGDSKDIKRGGFSRMTGLRSEIEIAPIIAIKGKFKYDTKVPPLTNKNLFQRDKHRCGYCGRYHKDEKLSRDHIIPVSKNGQNSWMNCITACKSCNRYKDDRTPEQADMPLLFVPYIPSPFEKLILQNRHMLPIQMDFLQDFLPQYSRLKQ